MKNRVNVEIHRTYHLMERHFENFHSRGMSRAQAGVIHMLAVNPDRDIFQRDIEKEFGIRRSTVSVMLSSMEDNGLITRVPVDHDARLKKLVLTEKSEEIIKNVDEAFDEYDRVLMRGVTDEEAAVFFRVLEKIRKNSELEERTYTENG